MEIESKQLGSLVVIRLTGRFDAHEIKPVAVWIKGQVDAGSIQVLVNLEGVNFIDSSGLSTLINGLKRCREKGGDLYLCCLQQPVRIIIELTHMDRAFRIFETEESASLAYP